MALENPFNVYVDFDRTLFNTDEFIGDLRRVVAEQAAQPLEQVAADATRFRLHEQFGGYDYEGHIRSYGLDPETMWQRLAQLTDERDYLFPDSVPFMQQLIADGFNPKILSFGEQRIQEAKIKPALPRLVEQLGSHALEYAVVFEPKHDHIAVLHPGERGVLVDDVADQQLPDGFVEIHLDRSQGEDVVWCRTPRHYVASSLGMARQAIDILAAA